MHCQRDEACLLGAAAHGVGLAGAGLALRVRNDSNFIGIQRQREFITVCMSRSRTALSHHLAQLAPSLHVMLLLSV